MYVCRHYGLQAIYVNENEIERDDDTGAVLYVSKHNRYYIDIYDGTDSVDKLRAETEEEARKEFWEYVKAWQEELEESEREEET